MGTVFSTFRTRWADAERRHLGSFGVIIGMFVLLLVMSLGASWFAIDIVNGTRAYATGEGRYSKAEKVAVIALHTYAYSGAEGDYRRFLEEIRIPLGDHVAREALEHAPPDLTRARKGFIAGANNPADVAALIRLFRWFSGWRPFAEAIDDWREGDNLVLDLQSIGLSLRTQVGKPTLDTASKSRLLDRLDRIDERMTVLENRFSGQMGEAARSATWLVIIGIGSTMVILWAIGIVFATALLRRQLELDRQLTSSEHRFRDFAEVGSDWYWEMDGTNRIEYMSDRFLEMLNLRPVDVLGTNGGDFIRNNAISALDRDAYDAAIAHREPFKNVRVRFQAQASGATFYWSISGKARFDAVGNFEGYRGVASDITAQVRDAQLMLEAKERAEVANRTKSEFLANMSHELRTPLNAILGFSEVIASRILGNDCADRYSEYANDIHTSGTHLLSIINDILDLSKVEAGHAELSESDESLADICQSLRPLIETRLTAAGLDFVMSLPSPDPSIRVDRRKLVQVLVNLLSNATKFTPCGGRVRLSACYFSGGLAISVSDTGIGIAPEHIETILQPFGQVESAFSRQHQGTGLGLPLARALIELHGGTLSIESAPGHGTEVTVTLPGERVLVPDIGKSSRKTASA